LSLSSKYICNLFLKIIVKFSISIRPQCKISLYQGCIIFSFFIKRWIYTNSLSQLNPRYIVTIMYVRYIVQVTNFNNVRPNSSKNNNVRPNIFASIGTSDIIFILVTPIILETNINCIRLTNWFDLIRINICHIECYWYSSFSSCNNKLYLYYDHFFKNNHHILHSYSTSR